jgi:DNA-binding IclR family transcriptional regulator
MTTLPAQPPAQPLPPALRAVLDALDPTPRLMVDIAQLAFQHPAATEPILERLHQQGHAATTGTTPRRWCLTPSGLAERIADARRHQNDAARRRGHPTPPPTR